MNRETILAKVQELREMYKKTADLTMRQVIEKRAALLKRALYKVEHKTA